MLATILAAVVLVGMLFAAMAIGVMFGGKPLRGSCGGPDGECGICGSTTGKCEKPEPVPEAGAEALLPKHPDSKG